MRNMETDVLQQRKRPRDKGKRGRGEKHEKIYMYYVQVPTPHNECNHYILQTHINEK